MRPTTPPVRDRSSRMSRTTTGVMVPMKTLGRKKTVAVKKRILSMRCAGKSCAMLEMIAVIGKMVNVRMLESRKSTPSVETDGKRSPMRPPT